MISGRLSKIVLIHYLTTSVLFRFGFAAQSTSASGGQALLSSAGGGAEGGGGKPQIYYTIKFNQNTIKSK